MHPECKEPLRTWFRLRASPPRLSARVKGNGAGRGIPYPNPNPSPNPNPNPSPYPLITLTLTLTLTLTPNPTRAPNTAFQGDAEEGARIHFFVGNWGTTGKG